MDWSDGDYELTAAVLAPASARVVEVAQLGPTDRVLDVATGTGNCALAASATGATVTAVDPARRLLAVAAGRPGGDAVTWLEGEGTALPVDDAAYDAVTSVFGVIFVPDAAAAVAELVRATAPGGRIVLSTWRARGAIATSGRLMRDAVGAALQAMGVDTGPPPSNWTDPDLVDGLLTDHGARVTAWDEELRFTHRSAADWFAEQEEHHPAWRAGRQLLDDETWQDVRRQSIEALEADNLDPAGLSVLSGYRVVRADLPA